jgi:hypothetical protein
MVRLVLLALVVLGVGVFPALAQDTAMMHVCDSTTILMLYIAEHDYGFHSMMDVSTFDKGQYAPLFDAMMASMEEGDMMTEEPMGDDMMATEEPMMGDTSMEGTMLMPLTVPDEDPECTALRAEVEAYLYSSLSMGMMEDSMG